MAATPAQALLDKTGTPYTAHTYDHDPTAAAEAGGYGAEAAAALGVAAQQVFKTLLVQVDSQLVVAICPVTSRLDTKAVAQAVGGKRASMADPKQAERSTGYVVGGISPLGQKKRLTTVLDSSAEQFGTIFVSGGRRGLDLELAPADLTRLTGAIRAAVTAGR